MFQVSVRQSHSHTECQLLHLKPRVHPHVESNFGSKKKSCYPTACATTVSCGFVFVRVWGCHFLFFLSYFGSNSFAHFPARLGIMDSSNGREIHYHLARAMVHLNCIAGFLPFFEPTVDWELHEADTYRRTPSFSLPSPHPPHTGRHLHTFVPIPSCPATPTLASHGGIPSHMIINPDQDPIRWRPPGP